MCQTREGEKPPTQLPIESGLIGQKMLLFLQAGMMGTIISLIPVSKQSFVRAKRAFSGIKGDYTYFKPEAILQ